MQVCWELTAENMKREMRGLKDAMEDTKAKNAYFITYQQNETLDNFKVLPAWQLQKENRID